MKKLVHFAAFLLLVCGAKAQVSPEISSWILNTTGATGYAGILTNVQTVQYSTNYVYVSCTCIPGYSIGPWNSNPNTPTNQNFVYKFPLNPTQNTSTPTSVGLGHVGVWTNGVSIFNADDGMTYNNAGVWHRNAYFWEGVSFDNCLGHPAPNGEYHHHVNPKCLYNDLDSTHHSPIIGYSFDGYPVYGAYAYTNTNGTGPIKRMLSSYQLRSGMTVRDTLPDGTVLSSSSYGPNVSTTYPAGCFMQDYKYVPGSGDLDDHNGRFCVTPEYPSGTYAYFVTIDASQNPVYPYVLGLTYYGNVQVGDTGPSGGHVTITETTTVYSPTTGINELQNQEIKFQLMPNPSSDYVYIYFDPNSKNNINGELVDSRGRMVQSFTNLQPSIAYTIDMNGLQSGMYTLVLHSGTTTVSRRIVKN